MTSSALLTLAFGSLGDGAWGAVWSSGGMTTLLGPAQEFAQVTTLQGSGPDHEWRLRAEQVELNVAPAAAPVRFGDSDDFEQLCRVDGRIGDEQIDSLARRAARADFEISDLDSVRDVAAWFEPDDGIGLIALRPRRSRGQDRDLVSAAVLDVAGAAAVADPRLSTTYDEHGVPVRAGVELWLDGDEETQYPRRAAGESIGVRAEGEHDGLALRAELQSWHSRGREGAGVYVLARPR